MIKTVKVTVESCKDVDGKLQIIDEDISIPFDLFCCHICAQTAALEQSTEKSIDDLKNVMDWECIYPIGDAEYPTYSPEKWDGQTPVQWDIEEVANDFKDDLINNDVDVSVGNQLGNNSNKIVNDVDVDVENGLGTDSEEIGNDVDDEILTDIPKGITIE